MNSGHHKTIFSKRLGCLVAVGEHASSQGKANGAASGQFSGSAGTDWLSTVLQFVGVLTASCALVTLAWAGPVATTALPTSLPAGGQVAQGAASISQSGAVMNITQSTPKAVVNWNTFDIGQNAKVNIVQPGADAVMLNRVTSANPSQILGQLNANGQVVLVNPNGVLFGKDGSVNASSFTASTLGITDANFMAGNQQFERNGSTATVVNQGRINTTGGYVALLSASVSNEGQINTQGGTAYLAAAETVKIPVSGSGRIKLELSPSRINAAVANGKTGTIVTEGGQVYMQAAALSSAVASIIQSGSIDTTGEQGGAVHLLADGGDIKVDGSITANSSSKDEQGQQRKGGDIVIGRDIETSALAKATDVSRAKLESGKGFVETSGEFLKTDGIQVKASEWLLDPNDIVIGSAATSGTGIANAQTLNSVSQINATDLGNVLTTGTSVTVQTSSSATGGNGDITVNAAISNTAAGNTLTLNAVRNVVLNNSITASNISLNAATGSVSGSGSLTASGLLSINSTTAGTLSGSISGSGGLTKTGAGTITLQGAKTYTGTTNVNAGTLSFTTSSISYASATSLSDPYKSTQFNIASGATLNFNIPTNVTMNAGASVATTFSGAGTFSKTGGGKIQWIDKDNTFNMSGGSLIDIQGGTFHASSSYHGKWGTNLSSLNIAAGATFDTSEADVRVDALTGLGALKMGWQNLGGITTGVNNTVVGPATFSGVVSANSGVTTGAKFTKAGIGTQILSGANTYTGGTTVSAGTLTASANTTPFGAGDVTIDANGTLALSTNGTNQPIMANNLKGAGKITYSGSAGNQMFLKGDMSAFAGTVTVGASGTGGSLWFNNTGSANAKFVVNTGNNFGVWSSLSGANGGVDSGAKTFNAGSLTGGGTVYSEGNSKQLTLSVGALGLTETFSGVIQNVWTGGGNATMNLTKVGAGTMTLTGTNTYLGGTQINAGTLASSNSAANFGTNTITVGLAGTLALSTTGGNTPTFTNALAGTGNITYTGSSGNQMFFSGDMSTFAGTFTITGISTTTWFNNAGSTSASFINNGNAMGIWSNNGGGGVSTGAKTFNAGSLTGTGQIFTDGGNTKSITLSVGALNKNELYSGKISNSWNAPDQTKLILTKVGTGTTTLTANNDYGGVTNITDGTLQIGNAGTTGTLGSGAVALSNDANLVYKRSNDYTITNAISGQGNVTADISGSGSLIVGNTITLSTGAASATRNKIDLRANGNVTLSKAISTNNTGSVAVKLVAGQAANYVASSDSWSSLSGNVIVDPAGAITVGNGGVAALYSGTIAGTTGIASMAVSGSGKFRYNSDETTTNFSAASAPLVGMGSVNTNGVNIIYREAPEITVTAKSTPMGQLTYNGNIRLDPNADYTSDVASAGKNGDRLLTLNETAISYGYAKGSGATLETDLKNAGTYTKTVTGLTNNLGYKVTTVNGSVVIDKANLVLSGSRAYDGTKVIDGSILTATGVTVGGVTETFAVSGAGDATNLSSKDASATAQTLNSVTGLNLGAGSSGTVLSGNYNSLSTTGSAVTINKANLVLSGSRAYDGTKVVDGSILTATGVTVGGVTETFAVSGAGDATNLSSKDASATAQTLNSVTGLNLGAGSSGTVLSGNYYGLSKTGSAVTINKAKLTEVTGAKTYDGNTNLSGGTLVIKGVNGEEFTTDKSTVVIASKDVAANATNKVTNLSSLSLTGKTNAATELASNYDLTQAPTTSNTVTINKLTISASISDVITTYGTNAGTGSVNLIGVIGPDNVSASAAGLVGTALSSSGNLKAGTYVQSVVGGLTGTDAGNYTFSGTSSANYVVNKLALNTQIAAVSTTYGTTAATGAASITGVLSGDKVDLANAKATLVDAANSSSGQLKAGTYKQTVANSLSGADADNYTAAPTSLANYVVTPKAIAATVTAADKVYDGTNVATLTANSADIVSGDVVNVLGATGTFASKNVVRDGAGNAVAQTVTVSGTGVGLGGADGANYTLTNPTSIASTTAKITPKDLSVTGITASDKVYDGSTVAAINTSGAVLAGLVGGDSVSVSTQAGVGNFASKNVAFDGSGAVVSQAVAVSGLSLSGADAGNYSVTDKSGATAKVLQRALSITGSVAQDKTVDGNTNAQVKPGQLVNLVAGESLVVSATGQFADAEIGTNKAVTTQYALANGANGVARNYTLAGEVLRAAILVASINPVQPIVNPAKTGGGSRVAVSGSGNSGAALGVAEGSAEEEVISREECSVLTPEKCQCQESTIAGVEMCFAPVQAANSKN